MSSQSDQPEAFKGLRSQVSEACRRTLREALASGGNDVAADEHMAACSFCAARLRAASSIAEWSAQRPTAPESLEGLLDSIYERVSETAEGGALGDWIQAGNSVELPADSAPELDGVVDSSRLASELTSVPAVADGAVWSDVRRSILMRVANDRSHEAASRRTPVRLMLASVAAALLIAAFVLFDFRRPEPVIVFADLDQAPNVDFAVVRYGVRDR